MRTAFTAAGVVLVLLTQPSSAARDIDAPMPGLEQVPGDVASADLALARKLELVRAAPVSPGQAITIAEKLHPGTKSLRIETDVVMNELVYRVRTARDGQVWASVVSGMSGTAASEPPDSVPAQAGADERRQLAVLQAIGPGMSDAVAVAERSTHGRAVLGELRVEKGRLKFAVVVLAGDDLKEVVLEPPGARLRR
jgi:uncharacterized membrane protein YkoI